MRLLTAQKEHVCAANPEHIINIGENYFGNSYNAFCRTCGIKKQKGELIYNNKQQRYIDPKEMMDPDCVYCSNKAIHVIYTRPVCTEHIQRSMEQGDDGNSIPSIE